MTGREVYDYLNQREETLASVARALKTSPQDVLTAAERLQEQRAHLEKQIQQLKSGATGQSCGTQVLRCRRSKVGNRRRAQRGR